MKIHTEIREEIARLIRSTDLVDFVYSSYQKNVQEVEGDVVVLYFGDGESEPMTAANVRDMSATLSIVIYTTKGEDFLDSIEEDILALFNHNLNGFVTYLNYTGFANDFGEAETPVISREMSFTVRI